MPNHTIYISAAITEQFDKEENKSGLINQLLAHHYGQVHTKTEVLEEEEEPDYEAMGYKYDPLMKQIYDENNEPVPGKVNKQGKIIELL